jgi:hypothetical protein
MDMRNNVFEVASHPEPGAKYQKIGRVHCFFFNSSGKPLLTLGPHCTSYSVPLMLISLFLLLVLTFIFLLYICPKVGMLNQLLGLVFFLCTIVSFLLTALINPGIVIATLQMGAKGDFNTAMEKVCTDCNVLREDFTEHCKKCRVCVEEYDDHYSLLGKCVGKHTIRYFYVLLFSSLCLLIFIVATLFFRFKDSL